MKHRLPTMLLVALLCLSTAGCGGAPGYAAVSTIGSKGGSISVSDPKSPLSGTRLDIDPGTLRSDLRISISSGSADGRPSRYQSGADIILGPDGSTFSQPATLTVPFKDRDADGRPIPPEFLRIWTYDPASGRWFPLETLVDPKGKTVSAAISHFSLYRVWALRYEQNTTVRYKISSLPPNHAGTDAELKAAITRAFATWGVVAKNAGIRFEETSEAADIKLLRRWARQSGYADSRPRYQAYGRRSLPANRGSGYLFQCGRVWLGLGCPARRGPTSQVH